MLEKSDEAFKGVVYYNKKNMLTIYERDNGPVPLEQSKTKIAERLAFWDQQHTTGSDIKLGEHMHAVLIVNKNNFLRDYLQAAWRLRGLDKSQKISFAVSEYDFKTMQAVLGLKATEAFNTKDLLMYGITKEAIIREKQNWISFKKKSKTAVDQPSNQTYTSKH